jgi:hypothetical protein
MTMDTQEMRSPERYLQLAATAEECARAWRRQAEQLYKSASQAEPSPPEPVAAKPAKPGPYPMQSLDKVIELCKRQSGATVDEVMGAAGWEKRPYPSTVGMLATRRGLKFWMSGKAGAKRYHMS